MVVKVGWKEVKWRQESMLFESQCLSLNAYHCLKEDGKALHLGRVKRNGKTYVKVIRDFFLCVIWVKVIQDNVYFHLYKKTLNDNIFLCVQYINILGEREQYY